MATSNLIANEIVRMKAKILVVEDEPSIRNIVGTYLENEGYAVASAVDGPAALKKAREWELPSGGKDVYKSPGHKEDWFKGIKTGDKTIMNIEAAVGVANLCVLGNLSYILGRKLKWDQAKHTIVGDQQAQRMMSRPQRHPYHL